MIIDEAAREGIDGPLSGPQFLASQEAFLSPKSQVENLRFLDLRPRTPIRLFDVDRPLTAHAVGLSVPKPPNLVAVDLCICRVLARIEQLLSVIQQIACRPKCKPRGAHIRGRGPVGDAEAHRLRLMRDDVHLLEARGGRVDGDEGEAVGGAIDVSALDDEGFRVGLVFDLSDVGGTVGVAEAVGLEVVGVEGAAANRQTKSVSGDLAFFEGCGGGQEAGGGGENGAGEEHVGDWDGRSGVMRFGEELGCCAYAGLV